MPSPRGTNHARLFITVPGPVAAYDAAGGLENGDPIERVLAFLRDKLSPADLAGARKILEAQRDGGEGQPSEHDADLSMDALPARTRHLIRMGNASSAADAAFAARHPDAARIRIV
jgi:hypothetical protein